MFLVILVTVITCFAIWLRLKWCKVRSFWAEKGVPHNPPHPLYGSLSFLLRENPAHWMQNVYKQFNTPYVGIWLFWRPGLVVNSPELARRILVKDADNFRNRFLSSGKSDPIGALNIFTVNEPLWSNIRRRLTTVFTAAKLRSFEGLVIEKTSDLIERLRGEMKKNPDQVNVMPITLDFSTDIIGEAAFGVKSQAALTGDSVVRKITREFMRFNIFRGLGWSSIFFCPDFVDFFGFSFFPKDTTQFLRKLFRGIVEQRGGFDKKVHEPRDLLDQLLKLRQDAAANKEEMSEDVLVAQAAIFLQGGFHTTGSALTWMFNELAHAPHIQDKLYDELVDAKKRFGKELDSSILVDLPYLNAIIKETLRKFSPMGWLDRIASKDYQIDDHLTIPAGTVVYVNAYSIMRDAQYYPEPDEFIPERFLPENEKDTHPFTYLPFGEGPRKCIGFRFAYISMRYALSSVVRQFTIRPAARGVSPNLCPVEKKAMFLVPEGEVLLIFTPRE